MAARIPPGTRRQTGILNALIARVIGLGAGTEGPPALFTTLGRHLACSGPGCDSLRG
jgi:hypothetical protein